MATVSDTSKNKNITLYQLATSLEKVQAYVDGKDSALSSRIDGKSDSGHKHASSDITSMGGYAKASEAAAIATTDSLNVAIGKIEKALDGKSNDGHTHDGRYYTETEIDTKLKSYVTSSSLTTTLSSYAKTSQLHSHSNKTVLDGITNDKVSSWDSAEANAKSYTDTKVAGLLDSAPEALNTLNELAAALGDDPNFATTISTQIGKKVDAVSGKGLSTNDFTNDYKTKLEGIKSGAEVNQNAFSNVKVGDTTVAADAKQDTLTLVAGSNVTITPDATNDSITIAAKDTTYGNATTSKAGLMTAAMVTKLNGIADNANAYSHPTYTAATGVPAANSTLTHGGTFTVSQPVSDGTGHVTAINSRTYTLPSETSLSKGTDATATGSLSHGGTFAAITGFSVSGHQITPTVTTYTLPTDNNSWRPVVNSLTSTATDSSLSANQGKALKDLIDAHTATTHLALGTSSSTAFRGDQGLTAYNHSQATHAPSNAEKNQNAFSNVVVGSTTIAADSTTDTLTIVAGNNITLTPDATNDKLTIAAKDTVYTHPGHTAYSSGLYKITVNNLGHVTAATAVGKSDITGLGIPGSDTTYSAATSSAAGLMSAADKAKLDGIAEGANNYTYTLPTASSSTLGGVKIGSNISVSSGTISLSKTNVTNALGYTPPTTNTTYTVGTTTYSGTTKLYTGTGSNTDGTMTQSAITSALNGKASTSDAAKATDTEVATMLTSIFG